MTRTSIRSLVNQNARDRTFRSNIEEAREGAINGANLRNRFPTNNLKRRVTRRGIRIMTLINNLKRYLTIRFLANFRRTRTGPKVHSFRGFTRRFSISSNNMSHSSISTMMCGLSVIRIMKSRITRDFMVRFHDRLRKTIRRFRFVISSWCCLRQALQLSILIRRRFNKASNYSNVPRFLVREELVVRSNNRTRNRIFIRNESRTR